MDPISRTFLKTNGIGLNLGVELDGHEWHERTRDQVIQRNQRDRVLVDAGWKVFHISGSELHRDPFNVVFEVFTYAANRFDEVIQQVKRDLLPEME